MHTLELFIICLICLICNVPSYISNQYCIIKFAIKFICIYDWEHLILVELVLWPFLHSQNDSGVNSTREIWATLCPAAFAITTKRPIFPYWDSLHLEVTLELLELLVTASHWALTHLAVSRIKLPDDKPDWHNLFLYLVFGCIKMHAVLVVPSLLTAALCHWLNLTFLF